MGRKYKQTFPVTGYNNWEGREFDVIDDGDQLVDYGDRIIFRNTGRTVKEGMSDAKLREDLGQYLLVTSSSLLASAQNSSFVLPN